MVTETSLKCVDNVGVATFKVVDGAVREQRHTVVVCDFKKCPIVYGQVITQRHLVGLTLSGLLFFNVLDQFSQHLFQFSLHGRD